MSELVVDLDERLPGTAGKPAELLQPSRAAAQSSARLRGDERADGQHLNYEQPLHSAHHE